MAETNRSQIPWPTWPGKITNSAKWSGPVRGPILSLWPTPDGGEIGRESHDQLLYFVAGEGKARIGDLETPVKDGDVSLVASGPYHNVSNTASGMLKLFTTDSPPAHEAGTEHAMEAEADAG